MEFNIAEGLFALIGWSCGAFLCWAGISSIALGFPAIILIAFGVIAILGGVLAAYLALTI